MVRMTPVADTLWKRYTKKRDAEARSQLLDRHLGLVYQCANEMAARVGYAVGTEELLGAGTLGLMDALDRFDLMRGFAFTTYAIQRIRGAILDELRSLDWRPRSVRSKGRRLAAAVSALETRHGRAPNPQDVARAMGVDSTTYYRIKEDAEGPSMISLTAPAASRDDDGSQLGDILGDQRGSEPLDEVGRLETCRRLRLAIATLAPRERTILGCYFYGELKLKQIAESLQLTESRVSQIRTQALKRLREQLLSQREDL
jgi:RNA polymerase sigma factor for flagellar operon FliA